MRGVVRACGWIWFMWSLPAADRGMITWYLTASRSGGTVTTQPVTWRMQSPCAVGVLKLKPPGTAPNPPLSRAILHAQRGSSLRRLPGTSATLGAGSPID
ncbi:hypothetical protein CQA4T8M7_28180 [Sphaerotilus natans]|nr:hypothetical protein CQA4T8M7_28180 [Sphaerotilus natans]